MSNQLIKNAFIVLFLSIFIAFSSYAMELPAEMYKNRKEILYIVNTTNKPAFINYNDQLDPHSTKYQDITEGGWLANFDPNSAAEFTEVSAFFLSKIKNGEPFASIGFFINRQTGKAQAMVKLFNRDEQVLNFDIKKAAWQKGLDLLFRIVVKDDHTKPEGNFEETYFELLSAVVKEGKLTQILEKVPSQEEQKEQSRPIFERLLVEPKTFETQEIKKMSEEKDIEKLKEKIKSLGGRR
jgi:hypothetical protein